MQRFWRYVGAVRPADRPQLRVKLDAGEVLRIAQWREDADPLPTGGVNLPTDAVIEREAKTMIADDLDFNDSMQVRRQIHAHDATQAGRCAPAAQRHAHEPS